jgi:hypothetical protein
MTNLKNVAPIKRDKLTVFYTTAAELVAREIPASESLLLPILKQGESLLLWASTGAGKTMVALAWALVVAGGGTWGKWSNDRPRKVFLYDGEMPLKLVQERITMMVDAIPGIDREAALGNLHVCARTDQHVGLEFLDIAKPEDEPRIVEHIANTGAELVIFDNLSTLATIENENDASDVNAAIRITRSLKVRRVASVVIHHSNKDGSDFRGSSNIATTFDVIVQLAAKKGVLQEAGEASADLVVRKFRGLPSEATKTQMVTWKTDSKTGKLAWTFGTSTDEVLQALRELLKTGEYTRMEDVAKALPKTVLPVNIKGTKPSKQWASEKRKQIVTQGLMTEGEIIRCLKPANDTSPGYEYSHDDNVDGPVAF